MRSANASTTSAQSVLRATRPRLGTRALLGCRSEASTDENGDTSAEGSLWERAAKMVDFNATLAQKDVSRMKEVLIRLKH